jgi:hypothetical protein
MNERRWSEKDGMLSYEKSYKRGQKVVYDKCWQIFAAIACTSNLKFSASSEFHMSWQGELLFRRYTGEHQMTNKKSYREMQREESLWRTFMRRNGS